MLKLYIKASEALKSLRDNKDGVVSFEYIIVAACIVGAVAAVFGATGSGSISGALGTGLSGIVSKFSAALG